MRDNHIRIDFFLQRGSASWRRKLAMFGLLVSVAFFTVLTVLTGRMAWEDFRYNEISMGLGVPRWWYTAWVPVLSFVISLRTVQFLLKKPEDK